MTSIWRFDECRARFGSFTYIQVDPRCAFMLVGYFLGIADEMKGLGATAVVSVIKIGEISLGACLAIACSEDSGELCNASRRLRVSYHQTAGGGMDLQQLLDRARSGDRAAWNQILSALRPTVRAWLRRRLRQDADASDLANVVQLRMDRGFARFKGETTGQLRAWSWRIALNVLRTHRRSSKPQPLPLPDALPAPTPMRPIVSDEDMVRLRQAMEELPLRYRTVIEGRLFDGLSCVEIAQRMHELPGTVRIWCFRAVNELREQLGTGT